MYLYQVLYLHELLQGTAGTRTGAVPYEYLGTAVPRYFQVLNLVPGSMEKLLHAWRGGTPENHAW